MPDIVTLYTFQPAGHPTTVRTVVRSTADPTFIDWYDNSGSAPSPPPDGTIISVICQPGTFDRYTYKVASTVNPFATFTKESNSPFCGYTPPACDITKITFTKTDETAPGANDGTANLFCTSSFGPITYMLSPPLPDPPIFNTTGYFTGLAPSTAYYINAVDTNECSIHQDFTILPFSEDYTHYKYRLQFPSANGEMIWELQLYDMRNVYLKTDYPKDVEGNEDPIVWTRQDQNEDKFSPIISHQLDISLKFDGALFTVEEFATVPEQSWYVQLVSGGKTYFKGYILPDEISDYYADPPYVIVLKATDGLPSLKGNMWGDGSGGQGYGQLQIQQYGLTLWASLLKQCLDQLRYDYGDVHIVSSLQYNNLFTSSLWMNISTWSDILYDSSGVPVSTYDALSLLLTGMKLSIVQEMGEFRLINWNDLYYINNGVVATKFGQCFYRIFSGFTGIATEDVNIEYQIIGFDAPYRPVQPPQTINYDKPYNIENDVSFNILALLYENPSFEIGAVQGELPLGFQKHGSISDVLYLNYDPLDPSNPDVGAADGSWELREDWIYDPTPSGDLNVVQNYIDLIDPVVIDQPGLLVNLSFQWRPKQVPGLDTNTVPGYALMFTTTGGTEYIYDNGITPQWSVFTEPPTGSELALVQHPSVFTGGDYTSWQSFSITTKVLPESGIGTFNVRFYSPFYYYNGVFATAGVRFIADVDVVNITTSSANPAQVNQTGETHITTVVTGLPPADVKQNDFKLFTYTKNKRVAGNIFYGTDYLTGIVANTWSFALKSNDPLDRLPATITKAYAREYPLPMYKYEGAVLTAYMSYYAVYGLRFYEGNLFMPFKIESHLRTNIHNITLIEITDQDGQFVYVYTPEYERNARSQ